MLVFVLSTKGEHRWLTDFESADTGLGTGFICLVYAFLACPTDVTPALSRVCCFDLGSFSHMYQSAWLMASEVLSAHGAEVAMVIA